MSFSILYLEWISELLNLRKPIFYRLWRFSECAYANMLPRFVVSVKISNKDSAKRFKQGQGFSCNGNSPVTSFLNRLIYHWNYLKIEQRDHFYVSWLLSFEFSQYLNVDTIKYSQFQNKSYFVYIIMIGFWHQLWWALSFKK